MINVSIVLEQNNNQHTKIMSLHSYRESLIISKDDWQFSALIMAAMRKADSFNIRLLENAFPSIHRELTERYNAPGGLLRGENNGTL